MEPDGIGGRSPAASVRTTRNCRPLIDLRAQPGCCVQLRATSQTLFAVARKNPGAHKTCYPNGTYASPPRSQPDHAWRTCSAVGRIPSPEAGSRPVSRHFAGTRPFARFGLFDRVRPVEFVQAALDRPRGAAAQPLRAGRGELARVVDFAELRQEAPGAGGHAACGRPQRLAGQPLGGPVILQGGDHPAGRIPVPLPEVQQRDRLDQLQQVAEVARVSTRAEG